MLFLIGFMGAGKTTLGKQLASTLGWHFLDLDEKIEGEEGKPVAELFALQGEAWFRRRERSALEALQQEAIPDRIVACGGGTPCYGDNMDWLNAAGTTVYLRVPVQELVSRLLPQRAHRPMISGVEPEDLETHITALLASREAYYLRARYILNPEQQSLENLAAIARRA